MKNSGLKESVNFVSVDYNSIDSNGILDVHKYLMKEKWYKIMFSII